MVNWVKRHEGYPEPVAHVDEQVPLWAPEQLPDWEKWFEFNTSPAQRARWSGEIAPKR